MVQAEQWETQGEASVGSYVYLSGRLLSSNDSCLVRDSRAYHWCDGGMYDITGQTAPGTTPPWRSSRPVEMGRCFI